MEWSGVNLDGFNEHLAKCTTEEERANEILWKLNELYGDAADKYRENNASIIAAREAQSDYNDKLAEAGERIEPVTTAATEGLSELLDTALELTEEVDIAEMVDGVSDAFDALGDGLEWVSEHGDTLIGVTGALTTALVSHKAATVAVTAAEAVKTAVLASGATSVTAATVATWALNGALAVLTSPVTLVAAAIAALIGVGVLLVKNWDSVKAAAKSLGGYILNIWDRVQEGAANIGQAIVKSWKSAFDSLYDVLKKPTNAVIGLINKAIDRINGISVTIPDWVPGLGGNTYSPNIEKIPLLASGGFTKGISIAGEAGTEAVISFQKQYRAENLGYWAKAGQLLGATVDDFTLSGGSGSRRYNLEGIKFAPNITVRGDAKKQDILAALEEAFPEFMDMLDRYLDEREAVAYG